MHLFPVVLRWINEGLMCSVRAHDRRVPEAGDAKAGLRSSTPARPSAFSLIRPAAPPTPSCARRRLPAADPDRMSARGAGCSCAQAERKNTSRMRMQGGLHVRAAALHDDETDRENLLRAKPTAPRDLLRVFLSLSALWVVCVGLYSCFKRK